MERLFQVFNFPFFPEVKTHGCLADFAHTPPPPRTDGPSLLILAVTSIYTTYYEKGEIMHAPKARWHSTPLTPAMPENYASSFYNNPFVSK